MTAGSLRMATAAAHMARQATCAALSFPSQSLSWLGIDPSAAEAGICVIAAVAAYTLATPLMANSRAMKTQRRRRSARAAMAEGLPPCAHLGKHKCVSVFGCRKTRQLPRNSLARPREGLAHLRASSRGRTVKVARLPGGYCTAIGASG